MSTGSRKQGASKDKTHNLGQKEVNQGGWREVPTVWFEIADETMSRCAPVYSPYVTSTPGRRGVFLRTITTKHRWLQSLVRLRLPDQVTAHLVPVAPPPWPSLVARCHLPPTAALILWYRRPRPS